MLQAGDNGTQGEALPRQMTIPLGVVVERQAVDHPWADCRWVPVSVHTGESAVAPWTVLVEGEGFTRYHAGTFPLTLYRSDTEAYRENLANGRTRVYVVLTPADEPEGPCPYAVRTVTVSPYEMQDYLDAGDDIVEAIALPESLEALLVSFIETHHVEVEFKKRKRDRFAVEEEKFGQQPIFDRKRTP